MFCTRSSQKSEHKNTTKNFVRFHNHSPPSINFEKGKHDYNLERGFLNHNHFFTLLFLDVLSGSFSLMGVNVFLPPSINVSTYCILTATLTVLISN